MLARRGLAAALAAAAVVAGCDRPPTKADILKKGEGAKTKAELEKALGAPGEVDKLGPIERWSYKASDGSVTYIIVSDWIQTSVTDDRRK